MSAKNPNYVCPLCKKRVIIPLNYLPNDFNKFPNGLIQLNFAKNQIDRHPATVFIDKKFKVRDFFVFENVELLPETVSLDLDTLDIDEDFLNRLFILDINIKPTLLVFILRSLLFNKKVLIILNDDSYKDLLLNLIKYTFQIQIDKINLEIISEQLFNDNQKITDNFNVVFNNDIILKDKFNILKNRRLKFEKLIVQKFYDNQNEKKRVVNLRKEILNIYELNRRMKIFYDEKRGKISRDSIRKDLERFFKISLSSNFMDYLIEVYNNNYRIGINLESVDNFLESL